MQPANKRNSPNRLSREKSPYLLQHQWNPVDWFPWGEEAFEAARREDKPIFLSIGYSTCHWCHVMAHESFEDPEVAALLNDAFINIKVDREERPDLDSLYMSAALLLSSSGGWPLTIIMTPEGKPFYAATYLPKRSRLGRPGLLDIVPRIKELWQNNREKITMVADQVAEALARPAGQCRSAALGEAELQAAFSHLEQLYDPEYGGFGLAPKFPSAHNLIFLLRYHRRAGVPKAAAMVEKTLEAMRRGGIYDHVGFGFHRYSTDREWFLPHFEKMLYDQAMLTLAYLEAYQALKKDDFANTAREIIEYVKRELTSPEGAFYSAQDADSEGGEGRFYLWSYDEVTDLLGPREGELFAKVFGMKREGNLEKEPGFAGSGLNLLHLPRALPETADELGMKPDELETRMRKMLSRLREKRENRARPFRDDKVLADWNGLMIAALARAGAVFSEPAYTKAAARAARFVLDKMRAEDGGLLHRFREGEAAVPGLLEDYAFMVFGLLELYEADFNPEWLKAALELNRLMLEKFSDPAGGFFQTQADDLITRPKDAYDGALPSGNSAAAMNLLRLSRFTGDPGLEEAAVKTLESFSCELGKAPAGYTSLLTALDYALGPSYEVVIAGEPSSQDTTEMLKAIRKVYAPSKVVMLNNPEDSGMRELAPFLKEMEPRQGKATAYICRNHHCEQPTTDAEEAAWILSAQKF